MRLYYLHGSNFTKCDLTFRQLKKFPSLQLQTYKQQLIWTKLVTVSADMTSHLSPSLVTKPKHVLYFDTAGNFLFYDFTKIAKKEVVHFLKVCQQTGADRSDKTTRKKT
jgi:hypothetical protein